MVFKTIECHFSLIRHFCIFDVEMYNEAGKHVVHILFETWYLVFWLGICSAYIEIGTGAYMWH